MINQIKLIVYILSADKIKQEKEYQRWRTGSGRYFKLSQGKTKGKHMNTIYNNSGVQ
jgi:hypothetical protein